MATVTPPPPSPPAPRTPTLGDVLTEAIPPARVLLRPTPGTATPADVLTIHDREGRLCELVDGTLVEKTVGAYESSVAILLCYHLLCFVKPRRLGLVLGPDGMVRVKADQIRLPDVAFYARESLPGGRPAGRRDPRHRARPGRRDSEPEQHHRRDGPGS